MGEMTPAEAAEYVLALKDCTPFLKQRAACDQAAEALAQLPAARAELAVLRHTTDLHRELTREQDQTIQQLRDRLTGAENEIEANEEVIGILGDDLQQLRDENRILKGFATDHGHDQCAALDQAAPEQTP
jgi:molybdopterin converting factor small subunit